MTSLALLNTSDTYNNSRKELEEETSGVNILYTVFTSTLLGSLTLSTVVGNVFVIWAIWMDRNLRTVQNYLVLSLAVADLMVACLVMPFGAIFEVFNGWRLGVELCTFWTSVDVLCCTASILHLVAIALDRYWAVTSVDYSQRRSKNRLLIIIVIIWGVGFIVAMAGFAWKDPEFEAKLYESQRCVISQDMKYQIFATVASFYGPLVFILLLYWRIYQVARKRIRNKPGNRAVVHVEPCAQPKTNFTDEATTEAVEDEKSLEETKFCDNGSNVNIQTNLSSTAEGTTTTNGSPSETKPPITPTSNTSPLKVCPKPQGSIKSPCHPPPEHPHANLSNEKNNKIQQLKRERDSKRERKTAKILVIITGVFIVCWLPFFVAALLMAVCDICAANISDTLAAVFLWLGYANSLLNPVIYTIFSPDFRNAFRRMLRRKGGRRQR